MIRRILSDAQWERVSPLLPGKPGDTGRSGQDNRGFLEAVLWIGAMLVDPDDRAVDHGVFEIRIAG